MRTKSIDLAIKALAALVVVWVFAGGASAATPRIFWASDPVQPNETVMLHGSDLGADKAVVEMARLEDAEPGSHPESLGMIKDWKPVPVLQGSGQTLKFVVPADWKNGVFACRVRGEQVSEPMILNAPDPWWIQGDEGESATHGGWLRIMGKCLRVGDHASVLLQRKDAEPYRLQPIDTDGYSLACDLADVAPGEYTVQVHNGSGGPSAWRKAGTLVVAPARAALTAVFSVLESYGPEAAGQMRNSLIKYNQAIDRTDGILAALKKAKEAGGGIVYFPAGRYAVKGPLVVPDHTLLKGEGEGVVTLWWGSGHFNLDGGGPQGRAKVDEPKPPQTLIQGNDFEIQNMSLFLPLEYEQGIVGGKRLRLDHVRIRIDHYWLVQGRGNGVVARLGHNFQVTHCDILAKGDALVPGDYGVIAHNRILSNKSNTPMGGSRCIIVEDNQFVSMDPTTYQNISGSGRNIYYGHNHQEALYAQQSDYSFTFDAGAGAYLGGISEAQGTLLTLAADPNYPKWANENHGIWKRSAVVIVDGRGAGQWRDVTDHHGRAWEIDRPFEVPPDATSVATIISFNGRVLVIGNQFEDSNWVNVGYGTSIDVICAKNHLARCADLMNYGLHSDTFAQPSWHVQYFDNVVAEGQTHIGSSGDGHKGQAFTGPLTQWVVHRRHMVTDDNSGGISLGGNMRDAVIEGCTLKHSMSTIKVDAAVQGAVLRNNTFEARSSLRYGGDGLKNAVVEDSAGTEPK